MLGEMQRTHCATNKEAAHLRMHAELQTAVANGAPKSGKLLLAATGKQATEDSVNLLPSRSVSVSDFDIEWLRHVNACEVANAPNIGDPKLFMAGEEAERIYRRSQR
jgi:hypothetical protein